ncbi:hypothetical protein [Crateriforma conspicua]|uniref:hypothetical protein n=1 Tax=Crateriforma conspicua TaxID=2527996 RepID=UPI00118A8CDD|nr:hypothetical protein [Crateriforma conspicua]QDV63048.1 hypothetical protein Mal65_21870 [Crateriforma conspicua]
MTGPKMPRDESVVRLGGEVAGILIREGLTEVEAQQLAERLQPLLDHYRTCVETKQYPILATADYVEEPFNFLQWFIWGLHQDQSDIVH